jgi:hypothetical protein
LKIKTFFFRKIYLISLFGKKEKQYWLSPFSPRASVPPHQLLVAPNSSSSSRNNSRL